MWPKNIIKNIKPEGSSKTLKRTLKLKNLFSETWVSKNCQLQKYLMLFISANSFRFGKVSTEKLNVVE